MNTKAKQDAGLSSHLRQKEPMPKDPGSQFSDQMYEPWENLCDSIEKTDNETIRWISQHFLRRLSIEAPVVVGFVFLCVVLHLLNMTILPGVSKFLGIDDYFTLWSPMQYVRMITHIFGHDGIPHLRGNMTNILLVGPSAEAIFGSKEILMIMLVVALSSGVGHIFIGRAWTTQLGASGVVFALILLNSLASARSGKIPLSFVMTACLYMGGELWNLFFAGDYVSHHAHLIGGVVGSAAGYMIHERKQKKD